MRDSVDWRLDAVWSRAHRLSEANCRYFIVAPLPSVNFPYSRAPLAANLKIVVFTAMKISKMRTAAWLLAAWSCVVLVGANAFSSRQTIATFPRKDAILSLLVHQSTVGDENGSDAQPEDEQSSTNAFPKEIIPEEIIPRGGENVKKAPPPQPSLAQFRKFALPCLGLWVAQPLLSLVDTAFVGLSGDPSNSARQLAALGPATTFFDGATYLFAFLNVATTNLYSSATAQYGERSDKAESVVRTASRVASRCGIGIMFFLLAFSRPLLALYIGRLEITRSIIRGTANDLNHILTNEPLCFQRR